MGRGPSKRQMGVGLPEDLRARLEVASAAAGHSVAEEIRRRVERTFIEDALDPPLRALIDDIVELAELVRLDVAGAWHTDPGAHAAFRSAVLALIGERSPDGVPTFGAVRDLFGAGISKSDDPDTIGRALVRHHDRIKAEREKYRQELLDRQKGKGAKS
jgi:plasmid stability protein